MAERGEGVVDFATPVALADEPGQGQTAGVFADGLAGGSGQVLDGKEGQAALLLDEQQDLDAPVVGGPLQDPLCLPSERCVHIGLDFDF